VPVLLKPAERSLVAASRDDNGWEGEKTPTREIDVWGTRGTLGRFFFIDRYPGLPAFVQ